MEERAKIDIHDSCASFSIVKNETEWGGVRESKCVRNNEYYSHINHWGLMTKPFSMLPQIEDFIDITPHLFRLITENMNKDVLDRLKKSEADWIMIDFYDSARIQWFYDGGWFTYLMDFRTIAPEYWTRIEQKILGVAKLNIIDWEDLKVLVHEYMDEIVQRYGNRIILNRVTMSRYWIDKDNQINEFDATTERLGSWKDNPDIRRLEDYMLEHYDVAVLDVSKFFVADWDMAHDALSVHFEREYYECADRALQKIVDGKTKCVDSLDEIAFANKMDRELITSRGEDNWKKYILAANTKFLVNPIIDALFEDFTLEELIRYRHEIAKLYRWVYSEREYFKSENAIIKEKQERAVDYFEKLLREK